MKDQVNQLFQEQLSEWDLAKNNYQALNLVRVKSLDVNGQPYQVQFNPARVISSSARVDAQSISERKCFLCAENRPSVQKGIPFDIYQFSTPTFTKWFVHASYFLWQRLRTG